MSRSSPFAPRNEAPIGHCLECDGMHSLDAFGCPHAERGGMRLAVLVVGLLALFIGAVTLCVGALLR